MYEYDYEQELKEKQNEIDRLEIQLAECQREIWRLHNVCRVYETQLVQNIIILQKEVFYESENRKYDSKR